MSAPIFLCGGNTAPGRRDDCPNTVHDHPLPAGYVEAGEVAKQRIGKRWSQRRCPHCGTYGWVTP